MIVSVVVVGAGLIGASVGLAARAQGLSVTLLDEDPAAVAEAVARGAGRPAAPQEPTVDLAVLAVPPNAVPAVLRTAQQHRLARVYTDVASVKASVVAGARAAGCDLTSFVPGHPMAGGERSGPTAARADLFAGRSWAICPTQAPPAAVDLVCHLVRLCGATPVLRSPEEHDRAVAAVSHTPHLVAGALAAALARLPAADLCLAGPGLRDTTRIAAGDPHLWTQILAHNATEVAAVATAVAEDLRRAAEALAANPPDLATVNGLLGAGQAGRAALEVAAEHGSRRGSRGLPARR
ncbi:prephenate dehydrogenase [Micromonospora endophytica]|nr:prephenate dehydrogenase [Micromonospora endophytica]BCJ58052.1 prephenate dehydrogenase [Micromonospora endophytica]